MEDCKGGNPWTATGGRETLVVSRLDRDWRKQNPEYESRKVNFFGGNVMSASGDKWIQSETPRASSSQKRDRKSSKNRSYFCTADDDERSRKGEKCSLTSRYALRLAGLAAMSNSKRIEFGILPNDIETVIIVSVTRVNIRVIDVFLTLYKGKWFKYIKDDDIVYSFFRKIRDEAIEKEPQQRLRWFSDVCVEKRIWIIIIV